MSLIDKLRASVAAQLGGGRPEHGTLTRQARPTLRFLDEIGEPLPPPSSDLSEHEHEILKKAQEYAPHYPANQVHIEDIDEIDVFRFTHGRWRVVDWLEDDLNVVWVCARDLRDADTYAQFIGLYEGGELLPVDADYERLLDEQVYRLARAIKSDVPEWLQDARAHPDQERAYRLFGSAEVFLFVSRGDAFEEIWVAVPKLTASVPGFPPNVRAAIVAAVQQTAGKPAEWEEVYSWPTRALRDHEVAHIGVRQHS